MTYPKPIKYLLHRYWHGTSSLFGWKYKQWFIRTYGKKLKLNCYKQYQRRRRRKNKKKAREKYGNRIQNLRKFKKKLIKYSKNCGICGIEFKENEMITVDHILPKSKYPELALDINNMQLAHTFCNNLKSNLCGQENIYNVADAKQKVNDTKD